MAALTWGNIKQWKPGPLDTAETNLRVARRSMLDLADELEVMGLPARWHGTAAETSRSTLKTVTQDLKDVVAEVSTAYTGVCDAADAVRGVELAVDAAASFASLNQLLISDAGVVSDDGPDIDTGNEHDNQVLLDERKGLITECVDRIEQALRKANDVDVDLNAVLVKIDNNEIRAGAGGLAEASKLGEVKGDLGVMEPPKGGTPSDNAAWWATMSPDERKEIIAKHPGWIGNRDGVDFTSRDLANRNILKDRKAYIPDRLAELEGLMAAARRVGPGGYASDDSRRLRAEYDNLKEEQGAIAKLDELLAKNDGKGHQLAGLDFSKERTQAILVNGNLDTAEHVAVFTPGMTSNVPGMGGYDSNMLDLKNRMDDILFAKGELGPDGKPADSATVTWMGYQAPQALPDLSVASSEAAKTGGEDLANFYRGVNSSRMTDPDLTALGHSYGSSTTGYALQHENTGVDHTVLFGSPGAATDDLDDYNTPKGSTFYAEASDDMVGDIGRFGSDPSGLDGVKHVETSDAEDPDGKHLESNQGHSQYLNDGTTTQYNIAQVATNHEEGIIEDDGQGLVDSFIDDLSDEFDNEKDQTLDTLKEEYEEKKRWAGNAKDWLTGG